MLDAINSVKICLERGGCQVVPGLPKEQYIWTLCTSILGGLVAGFASAPRKEGQLISKEQFISTLPWCQDIKLMKMGNY